MTPITPTPRRHGVRYVNIRVAIPEDSPFASSGDVLGMIDSHWQQQNQGTGNPYIQDPQNRLLLLSDSAAQSRQQREMNPTCTFIPLVAHDERATLGLPVNSPRSSPYLKASPTLSILSNTTAETMDTYLTVTPSPSTVPPGYGGTTPLKDKSICRVLDKSFGSSSPSVRFSPDDRKKITWTQQSSKDEDPIRKSRIKTELCMNYGKQYKRRTSPSSDIEHCPSNFLTCRSFLSLCPDSVNGTPCPFGPNCTYAHGEEELQMTKLIDLHRAGLVDIETYRTKPCLTWVSTGSWYVTNHTSLLLRLSSLITYATIQSPFVGNSPFGKRCTGIHDPRIGGTHSSWLPHTETQGNTIATDINVDGLHQKRLQTILQGNPFGNDFSLNMDGFSDLYKLVCNTANLKRRRNTLSELHKLQIALKMRGEPGFNYKFRPQHIIDDELCMVLQKRAFRVTDTDAIEIPLSSYSPKKSNHVLCREIAFGPDSDPAVRGPSLWFNINEKDVTICTPQQAKRYRWKKAPTPNTKKMDDPKKPSLFDNREFFAMIRPLDNDAFELATDILRHRTEVLKTERLASMRDRFDAIKGLELEKARLEEIYDHQRRHWLTWLWPVSEGRDEVDDTTPVPPVESLYEPGGDGMAESPVPAIWYSFASAFSAEVRFF